METFTIFDQLLASAGIFAVVVPFVLALLVFLLFWAFKKKLTKLLSGLLYRLLNHKTQLISREALNHAMTPCHSVFALIGLYLALSILGLGGNALVVQGIRIASIALIAWIAVRFWEAFSELLLNANDLLGKQLSLNLSKTLMTFFRKIVKALIIVFAALVILAETGTDVTALITGLGLGGLTFALAAQDTASNLFSGLVILLDRPFVVDDYIETPDVVGTVEDITFRSTRIRTLANTQIIVPNNVLTSKPITNWSRLQKRRVAFNIGLVYGTTSAQMSKCVAQIENLLNNSPDVVENSTCVNFDAFDASSLNISIVYYTKETVLPLHLKVKEALNLQIMAIVENEGCSFAYPTQTLHIKNDESNN